MVPDELLPPRAITSETIAAVARASLKEGGEPQPVLDFLKRVDWSRMAEATDVHVTTVLANLDAWLHLPVDRQLSRSQFVTRLLELLPTEEANAFRSAGSLKLSVRRPAPSEVRPRARRAD